MKNKLREEMVNQFVSALKEDKIPWEREWSTERAFNPVTGTKYRGENAFWLAWQAQINNYDDPRWCTFNQAHKNGWKIKKGEKGTKIEFFSPYDKEEKKKITYKELAKLQEILSADELLERISFPASTYVVFNGEQIEGIPEYKTPVFEWNKENAARVRERLFKNMGLTFHEGGDRAYYSPSSDSITLPEIDKFKDGYGYMATLLHEAGHATGHESRLNRNLTGFFGSKEYAKEELRAEIASAFTAQELGLSSSGMEHIDNHKAYIQSWISVLEDNPSELFKAIQDAEKISDYLIERGEFEQILLENKEKENVYDGIDNKRMLSEEDTPDAETPEESAVFWREQRIINDIAFESAKKDLMDSTYSLASSGHSYEELYSWIPNINDEENRDDLNKLLHSDLKDNQRQFIEAVYDLYMFGCSPDDVYLIVREKYEESGIMKQLSGIEEKLNKTIVAIESTDDYIDYEWGFNPVDGKPKYRLVQVSEDGKGLIGYPGDMFLDFNSMSDLRRYVERESDKIEVISYDEIVTRSLKREPEEFVRISEEPVLSFDEWMDKKGYDKSMLASDITYAEFMGGFSTVTTQRAQNVQRRNAKKIAYSKEKRAEYQNELNKGNIAKVWVRSKLDLSKETDRAYCRMQIKKLESRGEIEKAKQWLHFYETNYKKYEPENSVPDVSVTVKEMYDYGYTWDGMLPLSKKNVKGFSREFEIFKLYEDGTEALVSDETELDAHKGLFGITVEDWQNKKEEYLDNLKQNTPEKDTVKEKEKNPLQIVLEQMSEEEKEDHIQKIEAAKDYSNAHMLLEDEVKLYEMIIEERKIEQQKEAAISVQKEERQKTEVVQERREAMNIKITDMYVDKNDSENIDKGGRLATATLLIDDLFVVHGVNLMQGKNGMFVAMPSIKNSNGEYQNYAYFNNPKDREDITMMVMREYSQKMGREEPETKHVTVNMFLEEKGNQKAYCTVVIDGRININRIRVMEGKNGLFVSMPKIKDREGKFHDVISPASAEAYTAITDLVMKEYIKQSRQKTRQEMSPNIQERGKLNETRR